MIDHSRAIADLYKQAKKSRGARRVPLSQVGEKWDWQMFNAKHGKGKSWT